MDKVNQKGSLNSKLCKAIFLLLLVALVSLFIENTFYQYLDEDGFLHESLFLPLGAFSLLLAAVGLSYLAINAIWLAVIGKLSQ